MTNFTYLSIFEASTWASNYVGKDVTTSNISYLIQYGRVQKYIIDGITKVSMYDLQKYYESHFGKREVNWKTQLGNHINWALSFDYLKESDTTKHVHRLHPYKGKFIPQLVEYFIDDHTDQFKTEVYFKKGDLILDPFCGSGTTLVQANELGIHAIGIDVSAFNALISNVKIGEHNLAELNSEIIRITKALKSFTRSSNSNSFEHELLSALSEFNAEFFPSPNFKYNVRQGLIDSDKYGKQMEKIFLPRFFALVEKYSIELNQTCDDTFLDKWYMATVRNQIDFVIEMVNQIENPEIKKVIQVILSRTIRTSRATTHSDLGTLIQPISTTYYCTKHAKICKPLFSILNWWERYSKDTINRLAIFDKLRTETYQYCLTGDSTSINISDRLKVENNNLWKLLEGNRIQGIFSSPPYVGLIDYHEQHAYAYELYGINRQDHLEIGAMSIGQGKEAQQKYVEGLSKVITNAKPYLVPNPDIFLVANDKFNLYPKIANESGMSIVNKYVRPVLNRTERDKSAYSETIFHLKFIK